MLPRVLVGSRDIIIGVVGVLLLSFLVIAAAVIRYLQSATVTPKIPDQKLAGKYEHIVDLSGGQQGA